MSLTAPNLDDRKFQDLVDEARKRVWERFPEWNDHNVSDPGITLIELFAFMTEHLLYQLNRLPDKNYVEFLNLLGLRRKPPVSAKAEVTFYLNEPLSEPGSKKPETIPAFTQVATTRTETKPSVVFSTEQILNIEPAELREILTGTSANKSGRNFKDHNVRWFKAGFEGIPVFTTTPVPAPDDMICFGFDNDLSNMVLCLDLEFQQAAGSGIDITMPPYVWEASTGDPRQPWKELDKERVDDQTRGGNKSGKVTLRLPEMGREELNEVGYFWIRVRVKQFTEDELKHGALPYTASPVLKKVKESVQGGSVWAANYQLMSDEFVGVSDGTPNQLFYLKNLPVLTRDPALQEYLIVRQADKPDEIWTEVPDFADAGNDDKLYTLDGVTGEIRLGPCVPTPEGVMKKYGATPPKDARLIFKSYRFGGGKDGNIPKGSLNTLKTSLPFVREVKQHNAAVGGRDAQSLEEARVMAPAELRTSDRAVTAADYEYLALNMPDDPKQLKATQEVSRVKCIQTPGDSGRAAPGGQVYLLVIPGLQESDLLDPEKDYDAPLDMQRFKLGEALTKELHDFLDLRRLLTTRLTIREPNYQCVAVRVQLRPAPGQDRVKLERTIKRALYRFLNPFTGGLNGKGWEFGQEVSMPLVHQYLYNQNVPGVEYIRDIKLFNAKESGEPQGQPMIFIEPVAHGMVVSGRHWVEFV